MRETRSSPPLWVLLCGLLLGQAAGQSASAPDPEKQASQEMTEGGPDGSQRSERWIQRRRAKFNQVAPAEVAPAERVLLWVDRQVTETLAVPELGEIEGFLGFDNPQMIPLIGLDYKDHLFPQLGTVQTDSGLGPGLRYRDPQLGRAPLGFELSAGATLKRYQAYRLVFGRLPWTRFIPNVATGGLREDRDPFFLYADVRYQYFPEEEFFGPGQDSREGSRSDFLLEKAAYSAVAGFRGTRRLTVAFRAGLSQMRVGPGGDDRLTNTDLLFDDGRAPGLNRRDDFLELASSLLLDYRDTPGNPHQGAFLGFSFERFDDLRNSRFEFNRFLFDGRGYLPLGSPQRVLAVQFLTSLADEDAGARVPFYLQRTLGGKRNLRGFRDFRFRDENLLHLSAEYRWEAASAMEFAVFYDTGKVFEDMDDFSFDGLESSLGFGVRFKMPEETALRIDVARSDEGTRLYFTIGHPF